ncbi:hypothetical protein HDU76_004250 [Blyttiomyces sp. JEL0837]|nr:hypothetical protein HDU76_004250 [Blyttiomyces sp. JEL0837]
MQNAMESLFLSTGSDRFYQYEEGGENSPWNPEDTHSELFLNESPPKEARTVRDMNMETMYEYGSRVGVAVEHNPEAIKAMAAEGHEIASHNYRWIDYNNLEEETERKHVHLAIQAIKNACGKAPVGWYTGRISCKSRQVVVEEYAKLGLPLLYDSDAYNDELPYFVEGGPQGKHLVIPYTLDANDMKFCVPPGFTSPDGFFLYLKNTFDILYAEGKTEPKFMNVGLHCRLVGKPGRAAALKQFLDYVSTFEGVWVCTREEMARHWRKEFS